MTSDADADRKAVEADITTARGIVPQTVAAMGLSRDYTFSDILSVADMIQRERLARLSRVKKP
jgi:hypothetical protein